MKIIIKGNFCEKQTAYKKGAVARTAPQKYLHFCLCLTFKHSLQRSLLLIHKFVGTLKNIIVAFVR